MFERISFHSLGEIRAVVASKQKLVVSILDGLESEERPSFEGFGDVLRLTFEDTCEATKLASADSWPDEPTTADNLRFAQRRGERVFALSDAHQILEFVNRHRLAPDRTELLVHCFGGISRSAAVASWLSMRYWIPLHGPRSIEHANPRVLRLLDKAAGRH